MAKKILVVDDEYDDLNTAKNVLEGAGYRVVVVTDGKKVLDMLKEENFDLVLSNIMMPVMSGYELVDAIRNKLKKKKVKIAYISIIPRKEIDEKGVQGFVQKPYSPETLLNEVKRVLKNKK